MKDSSWMHKTIVSFLLIEALLCTTLPARGQDLVPTSSLSGGSSVFVFRSVARAVIRRFVPPTRPARTQAQRMETVKRIKQQYETIAKASPQPNRTKAVDPTKLPPKGTLPPDQASRLFAGVGEFYLQQNNYEQSFDFFNEAIRLDDKNTDAKNGYAEALATKGSNLLEKGEAEKAKVQFMEALKYDANNVAANLGLGEVYTELDQQGEAIKAYEKSLENGKQLTEVYVPLGILYYQSGEIAKADDMLTKALDKRPDVSETQFFLGMVRTSQNRLDDALAAFQKAKTLDPNHADSFFNSAETLVKLKRTADAIPDYQKATSLKPNYFEAWLGLGQALYETGKYDDAITAFKAAAKLKNNNYEVFAGLADSYRLTEKFDEAASNYNLAVLFYKQTKDFDKDVAADFYSKAGYVLGQQCPINLAKNVACPWKAAIFNLEQAVQLSDNPLDHANLGWAYYNAARADLDIGDRIPGTEKLNLAKGELQKAIAANTNPNIVDGALQNLGAVQNDLGDFAGAVQSLKGVAERHPEWNFSRYALATAYFKVNDFESASKWFRAVLDKDPKYVPALSSLGITEIKRKNKAEVKRIIDLLKTIEPGEAQKLEIQAKIAKLV